MFNPVDQGSLAGITLGVAVLFMGAYYAVIAGFVSDSFPTRIRYTGISVAPQLSGAVFGGLAPMPAPCWRRISTGGRWRCCFRPFPCFRWSACCCWARGQQGVHA